MRRHSVLLPLTIGLVACVDRAVPTGPALHRSNFAIADAPRGFTAGFYWLPPLVQTSALGTGTFDASLSPAVEICELADATCGRVLKVFTLTTGAGSDALRLDAQAEAYVVNWHTPDFDLSSEKRYRISVRAGPGVLLGYADVQPVNRGSQRRDVNPEEAIAVVIGQTLPIRFRIETGIVGQVTVIPAEASITAGVTQQFAADVRDLHGSTMSAAVTWASSNQAVATVNANGLATGVSAGTAAITATAEGVSGSSVLSVGPGGFAMVSVSDRHTCGVTAEGAAYCWGANDYGQLGDGSFTNSTTPVPVSGGLTFSAVTAGLNHTCGLTTSGAAYCWGYGASGQLGGGSTQTRTTPTPVSGGLTFSTIDAGSLHVCAITQSGTAYCWGANNAGDLGDGSTTPSSVPVPVAGGFTFSTVTAGQFHTCGVTTSGKGYCWGYGFSGQLGNGSTSDTSIPVSISGDLTFSALDAGDAHSCGLTTNGAAYCWGANGVGALGNGSTTASTTPVAVAGGLTFSSVTAGREYTCAVTMGGADYCWGFNITGQLGDGTTTNRFTPQPVLSGIGFVSLSASVFGNAFPHTCGVTAAGAVYCWGSNGYGQLGNGSTADSPVPLPIVFP